VPLCAVALVGVTGCSERARLIFDPASSQTGPDTFIDNPETDVARVPAGPMAIVAGHSIDPDGVDTLYVVVVGGNERFPPVSPEVPPDTLRFSLPISTSGHRGDTLTVLVFATDAAGVRGDTAARTLIVE
jgi:hypothetical protein